MKFFLWFCFVVNNFFFDWWKCVEEGILVEGVDMGIIYKL